jgi:hypothetical protein
MSRIILPDYPLGATIDFDYPSTDAYGQSIAPSSAGTLRIYKGSGSTPRSSSAGITHTLTHRATGVNHITIDTTNDTDAGFYQGESEYSIVLEGIVIHGRSLNLPVALFSIDRYLPSFTVVADGSNSATTFKTDRTETQNDAFVSALIRWRSGTLKYQIQKVSAYNGTTKFVTVASAFTGTAPTGAKGVFLV